MRKYDLEDAASKYRYVVIPLVGGVGVYMITRLCVLSNEHCAAVGPVFNFLTLYREAMRC